MEIEDEPGFAAQDKPKVVFLAIALDHGFVGVPLVRVEVQHGNELYRDILEHRSEAGTQVADGRIRHLDTHHSTQNRGNIAE